MINNPGDIIKPGNRKTIGEMGMPFFKSQNKYGNLYIDFEIVYLNKLSDEQGKKIAEILNNKKINYADNLPKGIEEYNLKDYDKSRINTLYKGGKVENEEDEDNEKVK